MKISTVPYRTRIFSRHGRGTTFSRATEEILSWLRCIKRRQGVDTLTATFVIAHDSEQHHVAQRNTHGVQRGILVRICSAGADAHTLTRAIGFACSGEHSPHCYTLECYLAKGVWQYSFSNLWRLSMIYN